MKIQAYKIPEFAHKHPSRDGEWYRRSEADEAHIKAMEAKQNELRDCRSLLDFKRDDIRERDEHIKAQAKEIADLKKAITNILNEFENRNDSDWWYMDVVEKYTEELTK